MHVSRRQFLGLAVGCAAFPAGSRIATAQTYPARPVRLIVGAPAGSSPDITARLMGGWLAERLGQPFVIENRQGAGGNLAVEAVVGAAPDGYTLHLAATANVINATLYNNLKFNYIRDVVPVASIVRSFFVMEVNPSLPARTVTELIAYAKANPGKLNMASAGNGTPQHVCGELFKMMTGANMLHVPYRGGTPALTDLMGGKVDVLFDNLISSVEHVRAGALRALAVTSATRSPALPEVPAMAEFVPGYEVIGWFGIDAPKGTPAEIVDKLNKEINAGLADPKIEGRFAGMGAMAFPSSPADFGRLIAADTEKWAKVVKYSGAKPD
jgi:tripartite-type tricarboxylate transporter receptor subunit TctC